MPMLLSLVTPRMAKFLGIAALVVAVLGGAYYKGVFAANHAQEVEDLKSYVHTQEKIDEVKPSIDRGAAIERLRTNGYIR